MFKGRRSSKPTGAVRNGSNNRMKNSTALATAQLVVASIVWPAHFAAYGESLEEFQQQQMQAMDDFAQEESESFEAWKQTQNRLFTEWSDAAATYDKTRLRNVEVKKHGAEAVGRKDVNFRTGKLSVDIVSGDTDSAKAVAKTKKALRTDVLGALAMADSVALKSIPPRCLDTLVQRVVEKTPVNVARKEGGFFAEAKGSQNLTGASGILTLLVSGTDSTSPPPASPSPHTALIVDAARLGFDPCLVPTLVADDGTVLYGPRTVLKEHAINGMAKWVASREEARNHPSCGKSPLETTAKSKPAPRRLGLNTEDSQKVIALSEGSKVLQHCKIFIVTE